MRTDSPSRTVRSAGRASVGGWLAAAISSVVDAVTWLTPSLSYEPHVEVRSRLVRAGRPRQRLLGRVEDGARGQVVGPVHQPIVVRIGGVDGDPERLPFLPADRGLQRVEHRGAVDAGDRDGELLWVRAAARVVDFDDHAGLGGAGHGRHPADQAGRRRRRVIPGGTAVQQVAQRRIVRVAGQQSGSPYAWPDRRRREGASDDDRGRVGRRGRQHAGVEGQPRCRRGRRTRSSSAAWFARLRNARRAAGR